MFGYISLDFYPRVVCAVRVLTKVRVALCVGCSDQYAHDRKACPPAPEATARAAWPGKPCHTRAGGRRERGEAVHEHWSTKGLRTSKFQFKEKTPACLTQRGWSSSLSLMSWTTCMARDQRSSAGGKGATRSVLNSPTGATFSQANKDRKGLRMVSRGVQHRVSGAVSERFSEGFQLCFQGFRSFGPQKTPVFPTSARLENPTE